MTLTTRTKPQFCPSCFTMIDATSSLDVDKAPKPGDFCVCIYCAAVLRLDDDMTLLLSSLLEVPVHSRIGFADAVTAAKELIERRRLRTFR